MNRPGATFSQGCLGSAGGSIGFCGQPEMNPMELEKSISSEQELLWNMFNGVVEPCQMETES